MSARRYLLVSLAASIVVVAVKLLAWRRTGSLGFLSDAMESVANVAAAGFALLMIQVAGRPPDAGHPFGHSKAEYFSSGVEGLLIGSAAVAIIVEASQRLLLPHPIRGVPTGAALIILASALNWGVARWMLRGAGRLRSIALEADARHLMADVWTSAGVIAGVVLVPLTGWLWIDSLVGFVVALHIMREAWTLVSRSVDGLMDGALPNADLVAVERVLERFRGADVRFDHIRTRRAGARRFVSMHMHVPARWSLARAARHRRAVEQALLDHMPGIGVTIELLPQWEESVQDRDPPA